MTISRSALILSVITLIMLALVPAVSASTVTKEITQLPYTDTQREQTFDYYESEIIYQSSGSSGPTTGGLAFKIIKVQDYQNIHYMAFESDTDFTIDEGQQTCWYKRPSDDTYQRGTLQVIKTRNVFNQVTKTIIYFYPLNWEVGAKVGTYESLIYKDNDGTPGSPFLEASGQLSEPSGYNYLAGDSDSPAYFYRNKIPRYTAPSVHSHVERYSNEYYSLSLEKVGLSAKISLQRVYDGENYFSTISINDSTGNILTDSGPTDVDFLVQLDRLKTISVTIGQNVYVYNVMLSGEEPTPTPTQPAQPLMRTGTVTMTDHNGTTISGFSVKAVNAYTGVEYDVSTETDVAVITLPMDRTISLRNPQTGQYEDVPVGYYYFYGYKSGYKMTNEDGIRITVMPEQYQGSYQLCDIIVTSEDGYLTGKHQFQIRSRADLRILQTGTISAQSATTGEWYNATVVDGIATLILPYDTSDSISPYVGNYYVYATSPGYIPSEYGTQISVRPTTQSEIRSILLTPIGGIPEAGNVTLRIQVISDSGQGIPNAEILIDGVDGAGWEVWDTYTTSSSGYLEVSVYENSTYDIIVYATGYYDSGTRIEVGNTDPPLMEFKLYPTGVPTPPTTQPTGWVTPPPTTQPTGIPDEDDDSEGFLMEAIRGISRAFGVGFATGKLIFGMLLALAIGFATAKHLRGGAAEFGLGLLGGTMLGVLIGLLPIWTIVVLLLIVGMYIGYRYVGGGTNG